MSKTKKLTKSNAGRPSAMTQEVVAKLESVFSLGVDDTKAIRYAGVDPSTYYRHYQANPDFAIRMQKAKDYSRIAAGSVVMDAVKNRNLKAAMWWLEKKYPTEFAGRPMLQINQQFVDGEVAQTARLELNPEFLPTPEIVQEFGLIDSGNLSDKGWRIYLVNATNLSESDLDLLKYRVAIRSMAVPSQPVIPIRIAETVDDSSNSPEQPQPEVTAEEVKAPEQPVEPEKPTPPPPEQSRFYQPPPTEYRLPPSKFDNPDIFKIGFDPRQRGSKYL